MTAVADKKTDDLDAYLQGFEKAGNAPEGGPTEETSQTIAWEYMIHSDSETVNDVSDEEYTSDEETPNVKARAPAAARAPKAATAAQDPNPMTNVSQAVINAVAAVAAVATAAAAAGATQASSNFAAQGGVDQNAMMQMFAAFQQMQMQQGLMPFQPQYSAAAVPGRPMQPKAAAAPAVPAKVSAAAKARQAQKAAIRAAIAERKAAPAVVRKRPARAPKPESKARKAHHDAIESLREKARAKALAHVVEHDDVHQAVVADHEEKKRKAEKRDRKIVAKLQGLEVVDSEPEEEAPVDEGPGLDNLLDHVYNKEMDKRDAAKQAEQQHKEEFQQMQPKKEIKPVVVPDANTDCPKEAAKIRALQKKADMQAKAQALQDSAAPVEAVCPREKAKAKARAKMASHMAAIAAVTELANSNKAETQAQHAKSAGAAVAAPSSGDLTEVAKAKAKAKKAAASQAALAHFDAVDKPAESGDIMAALAAKRSAKKMEHKTNIAQQDEAQAAHLDTLAPVDALANKEVKKKEREIPGKAFAVGDEKAPVHVQMAKLKADSENAPALDIEAKRRALKEAKKKEMEEHKQHTETYTEHDPEDEALLPSPGDGEEIDMEREEEEKKKSCFCF